MLGPRLSLVWFGLVLCKQSVKKLTFTKSSGRERERERTRLLFWPFDRIIIVLAVPFWPFDFVQKAKSFDVTFNLANCSNGNFYPSLRLHLLLEKVFHSRLFQFSFLPLFVVLLMMIYIPNCGYLCFSIVWLITCDCALGLH